MSVLSAGIALAMAGSVSAAGAGRYIVQLEDGVSAKMMTGTLGGKVAGQSAKVHHAFEELGAIAMTLSKEQLKALRNDPRVKNIEIDPKRYPMAQTRPYGIDLVGAPTAWAGGHTGSGVMVCVIDSGIKADHEDFAGVNIVGGYPSGWNSDSCGHGTHVAGTIAAQDNSTGVIGVSPGDVDMYIVQVFSGASCGWSYASDLADAASRCKTAADAAGKKLVINMSLGGSGSSTAEGNAFQNLYNQGVLSIAAAGNDGNSTMSYPASYDSVVSIAAVDSAKAKADFSQYNGQVELSAPGVAILSTYPIASATTSVGGANYTVAAMEGSPQLSRSGAIVNGGRCTSAGSWSGKVVLCERGDIAFADKVVNAQAGGAVAAIIYNNVAGSFGGTLGTTSTSIPSVSMSQEDGQDIVASRLGQTAAVSTLANNNTSAYASLDGTSMATPHAVGAAAVIWSSNLNASNADVRDAMTSTAEDLGSAGRDSNFGYGLIDIPAAIAALSGPTPDTTPPSTVSGLSATAAGTSSISLSWSAATDTGGSGLAGYKIERCSGSTCTNYAQIATTTSTSYSNTGLAEATTYRYRVRAYDAAGNNGSYSSVASASTESSGGGGGGSVLANGVPVTGLSGSTGTQLAYTIEVPAGASNLSFDMAGGSGDADLYVRFGSAPTTSSYDCRSWASGNTESCDFASPQAGTYHVMVNAYSTFSGASLVASFDEPSGGGGGTEPAFFENTANYTISDRSTTTSPISVSGRSGSAPSDLLVSVDIKHTYIGDLRVRLIAPDGSRYTLHNRSGGGTDNLQATYQVNASSETANGTWGLEVYDAARGDVGYIDSWSLQF
jgi:subtilisin family serine protease